MGNSSCDSTKLSCSNTPDVGSSKSGAGATRELSRNLKPKCGSAATGTGSALRLFGAWVCWLCENSLVSRGSTGTAWVSVCTLSSSEARGSMATIAGGFFLCCAKASQRPAREATPRAGKSDQPRGLGGRTRLPSHRVPHDEAYLEEALSHEQGVLTDRGNLTEMTAAIQRGTAQERRDSFVKTNWMPGKRMRPKVKAESAADGRDQKTKLVCSRKR